MSFDFKETSHEFQPEISSGPTDSDYAMWTMAHTEPQTSKTSRFLTVSATVHVAAAFLIAIMAVPLTETVKTETITIEIEDTPAPKIMANRGAAIPATQGGGEEAFSPEDIIAPAAAPVTVTKAEPRKAKTVANAKASSAKVAKATKSVAPKTNFQAVPATIDDLDAPSLDEGALAAAPVKSTLDEDFNEDLDQVDMSHQKTLAQEKNKMEALAAAAEAEQDSELGALDEDNKAEAAQLHAATDALKAKNAQQIANAIASEKAAAQAQAAGERAAAAAAARQAALQRAKQGQGQGGSGQGQARAVGQGAGNNGENQAQNQVAGTPNGIRSLDQLRQMPGNPRPQYDRDERLRGHAGDVAFVAYISKAGAVTQFRMMKSTGYRNLDSKTLAALKKWRFYPGQEGWVELPFRWDLKGDVQGDGGMLRGAVSQN